MSFTIAIPRKSYLLCLGNPAHAKDIVYRPRKIFKNASKTTRIYNEMWTGEWWNTVQVRLTMDMTMVELELMGECVTRSIYLKGRQ